MKSCPTCNRTFEDSFTFCLIDGAVLSAPFDPQVTKRIPEPYKSDSSATDVLPGKSTLASTGEGAASRPRLPDVASQSTQPSPEPESRKTPMPKRIIRAMIKGGLVGIFIGALVAFIVEVANNRWRWNGNSAELGAVGRGAWGGFLVGAILLPPLWRLIKYVWKD